MHKVLIASKSCRSRKDPESLTKMFTIRGLSPILLSLEDAEDYYPEIEAVLVGMENVDAELMDRMPKLKLIQKFGVGTENIDHIAASKRGILVGNMPGINADSVSEMALGLMFAVNRGICFGDRSVRNGGWPRYNGLSVCNKTIGIIGTGAIGISLAKKLAGLNMTILGYSRTQKIDFIKAGGSYVSLEELIKKSDIISVHCPLTDETRHLINKDTISKMKPSAIIINTARGPVIDENSLYEALLNNQIAGAGLDVLEVEPPIEDKPLFHLDNVVVTPHIAGGTRESMEKALTLTIDTFAERIRAVFNE